MSDKHIAQLAKLVMMQNEQLANVHGQLKAMVCALAAMARTHPDPNALAEALRRAWLQADDSLEEHGTDQHARDGIEQVLEVLEGNCPVPLNIRPPGKALPPETGTQGS